MGLAHAAGTQHHHVLPPLDKAQPSELLDLALFDTLGKLETETLQGLYRWKARHAGEHALRARAATGGLLPQ